MTIQNVLKYVDELYENVFSDSVKLRWLNQLEAELQTEVLLLAADGITQYTGEDEEAELIAPAPFDKIYEDYLIWRIAIAQGEAERANNLQQIYEQSYLAYVRFVCETVNPGDGQAEATRYYLSAYQIAVKHGYAGTETEWLDSLKGTTGEPGTGLNIKGQVQLEAELPESGLNEGDGYLVGSGTEALLYIWDGNDWFYKQRLSIKGDKGDKGDTGATGPQGDKGETGAAFTYDMFTISQLAALTGPKGDTGDTGPQGPTGPQGAKGDTGDTGPQGAKGDTGATGPAFTYDMFTADQLEALKGPKGDTGETGPQGPQGIQGAKGEKGETGDTGPKGDKGETGATGPQGPTGEQGPQGERGPTGPKGDTGATGPAGPKGDKGDTGETGKGLDILGTYASLPALQAAVTLPGQGDMYNVGAGAPYTIYMYDTVQGWVSQGQLQGAKGTTYTPAVSTSGDLSWSNDGGLANPATVNIKGPKGDDGEDGAQGEKGDKGDTGATGPAGPKGDTGETGPQGPRGVTGPAGEKGTTFTPAVSTSGDLSWNNDGGLANPATVNIKGPKGDKGETGAAGPAGADGATGAKGDKGETGATGPQGPTGETGPAGAKGTTFTPAVSANGDLSWSNDGDLDNPATVNIKGPQGETGATGPAGKDGADGAPGAKGDKGDKGDTGPQGPTGEAGPTGPTGATGPAGADGASIQSMTYNSSTNKWTVTMTSGSTMTVDGPAIPDVSAYMPKSGGTFSGAVKAASAATGSYYVRNIKFSTEAETPTTEGDICFKLA